MMRPLIWIKGEEMSEVKRYGYDNILGMIGSGYGVDPEWVKYSDYAVLQQKLDAVLAENVALKGSLNKISFTYGLSPHIQQMTMIETPATDAILSEVRAEGVEIFAAALKEKYAGVAYELIGNYDTNGEEDRISDEGEIQEALHFATQLRAGSTEGGV